MMYHGFGRRESGSDSNGANEMMACEGGVYGGEIKIVIYRFWIEFQRNTIAGFVC